LHRPLQNFEGGTLLVGTTQSGKGVALANLITQAIRRGDVVIVIDPKNSRRLKRVVERAVPTTASRIPSWNSTRRSRSAGTAGLSPSTGRSPPRSPRASSPSCRRTRRAFSAFGWDAVNVVVQGLVEIEERPNLVKLTKYIEGGIEPVLESSLRRYYDQTLGAGWRDLPEMKKLLNDAQRGNCGPRRRPAPT
jgi:conjugal transfer pilus assembly protein TraD